MRQLIKKVWKSMPPWVNDLIIKGLCAYKIGLHKKRVIKRNDVPVYIIGCFQAGGVISRSAQLYADVMQSQGAHVICVDTTQITLQTIKNPVSDGSLRFLHEIMGDVGAGTVIIHHNPPQFQWVLCKLGKKFLQHKHIIAYWAWELEGLPPLWKQALCYVDAVETPSSFTQMAVTKQATCLVTVKPHMVPLPQNVKTTFCQDGKLHCLFIMDMASLAIRKNPEAVVRAFVKAFSAHEASLTIKLCHCTRFQDDYNALVSLTAPHKHITLRTEWMSETDLEQLYLEHDVYISLHNSEGYGLTIREAMLRGLYIVATGWSGNMDFMHGEKCYPVAYSLVPVPKNTVFARVPHAKWAKADVDDAAEKLKKIYANLCTKAI